MHFPPPLERALPFLVAYWLAAVATTAQIHRTGADLAPTKYGTTLVVVFLLVMLVWHTFRHRHGVMG